MVPRRRSAAKSESLQSDHVTERPALAASERSVGSGDRARVASAERAVSEMTGLDSGRLARIRSAITTANAARLVSGGRLPAATAPSTALPVITAHTAPNTAKAAGTPGSRRRQQRSRRVLRARWSRRSRRRSGQSRRSRCARRSRQDRPLPGHNPQSNHGLRICA